MKKFIVYKATGGMTHMLAGLCYAMEIAKRDKRMLIIDTVTGQGSLRDKFTKYFKIVDKKIEYTDDFSYLPEDIEYQGLNREKIEKGIVGCFKDSYYAFCEYLDVITSKAILNKNSSIEIFGGYGISSNLHYFFSKIKLQSEVSRRVKEKATPIPVKYIGVHFRNTDMKHSLEELVKQTKKKSKKKNIKQVYLATDDYKAKEIFERELPGLKIISYVTPFNPKKYNKENDTKVSSHNTHYHNSDARSQTIGYLVDVYMLLKADYFVPSTNSTMSQIIISMRKLSYSFFSIYEDNILGRIKFYLRINFFYFKKKSLNGLIKLLDALKMKDLVKKILRIN